MSQTYTTGDLAKLAGVSVRTVQYYDKRGILLPSQLTEGGRRIYTESDLERLHLICFLRELDFSIEQIKRLFAEKNAKQVLELLLVEHIKDTKEQLAEKKAKLDTAVNLLDRVKSQSGQSLDFLSDISLTMKNQLSLKKVHRKMFFVFLPLIILQVGSVVWAIVARNFWIYLLAEIIILPFAIWFAKVYAQNVAYVCPNCHHRFQPNFKTFFFAPHTPKTRKLTCPHCHEKSYCLEVASK
ncbi:MULTISPECIES: MerR family transcriptional regulator [Streptococcus]|uniref:MerR family transcriptional regulator n=2 Tax=Streptococcus TaxID=1301 RepID=A0AAE6R5Y9_9STRE|nr:MULTISPECIES: MerR family transcriptional regulator [Streptococcus]MEE1325982.1 MerR family transcriptional regulator [Streptococcus sp.]QGZ27892.1 MerR family transcriptional regulator [Streptococcus ruminicola]SDW66454.1 DNA-binding transcriptional regulator, MerR family [Streptococcus equinus]SEQ20471.1 DNA-binding transcriptional regulator, MerR family [Streptococcus equinus]